MNKRTSIFLAIACLVSTNAFSQDWKITGSKILSEESFKEFSSETDYLKVVESIKSKYRELGYPVVNMNVDLDEKKITISEPVIKVSGKYSEYFSDGQPLNNKEIELSIMRMKSEANLNGENVSIDIGSVVDGVIPVEINHSEIENFKDKGGSIIFTTLGQRYSGPDVLTGYAWKNLDNGQQIDVSLANGFQWREESEGGKYVNGTLGYKNAHKYGTTSIQGTNTRYKVGGEFRDLDLTGEITSLSIKNEYLVNKNFVGYTGLTLKRNEQKLGAIGLWEKQDYSYLVLGGTYFGRKDNLVYSVNAEYEQGLGGKREFNLFPLMGEFNPKFTNLKLTADMSYKFENEMSWQGKVGLQSSTKGTPSANAFYIGGPDRGRAYTTGFATMPSGFFVSNTLNFKEIVHNGKSFIPYIGYDYASGKMATGENKTAQSAFVGVQYKPSKTTHFNLVFAKEVGADKSGKVPTNRLNLTFSKSF